MSALGKRLTVRLVWRSGFVNTTAPLASEVRLLIMTRVYLVHFTCSQNNNETVKISSMDLPPPPPFVSRVCRSNKLTSPATCLYSHPVFFFRYLTFCGPKSLLADSNSLVQIDLKRISYLQSLKSAIR